MRISVFGYKDWEQRDRAWAWVLSIVTVSYGLGHKLEKSGALLFTLQAWV